MASWPTSAGTVAARVAAGFVGDFARETGRQRERRIAQFRFPAPACIRALVVAIEIDCAATLCCAFLLHEDRYRQHLRGPSVAAVQRDGERVLREHGLVHLAFAPVVVAALLFRLQARVLHRQQPQAGGGGHLGVAHRVVEFQHHDLLGRACLGERAADGEQHGLAAVVRRGLIEHESEGREAEVAAAALRAVDAPRRHADAMVERERRDFHHEFATYRFRAISEHGSWAGRRAKRG